MGVLLIKKKNEGVRYQSNEIAQTMNTVIEEVRHTPFRKLHVIHEARPPLSLLTYHGIIEPGHLSSQL